MSAQVKSYFLAPSWDFPPNGPLKLGNIILSPSRPVPALQDSSFHTFDTSISSTNSLPSTNGFKTTKQNVAWTRESHISGRFGVWTSFLQFVGIDVGVEISKGHSEIFEFEEMVTEELYPDDEALRAMIEGSARVQKVVQKHMENRIKRTRPIKLFIIVGIKTVKGARVKRKEMREKGVDSEVSLDGLAAAGVPALPGGLTLGPNVGLSKSESDEVSFEGSDDFVFAYRVRKVEIRKGGELEQKDYRKGALYGTGERADEGHAEGKDDEELMISALDDEDFEGSDELERATGLHDDDGEEVLVVIPDVE